MRRPIRPRPVAHLAALLLCAATARAQVLEQSFQLQVQPAAAPFQTSVDLPLFDPASGTLIEARITLTPHVAGVLRAENTDTTSPHMVTLTFASVVTSNGPDGGLVTAHSNGYVSHYLMPFDGAADFAGSSGMSQPVLDDQPTTVSILPAQREFESFIGPIGGGGTMPVQVNTMAVAECEPYGDPAILFSPRFCCGPEISITYRYTTHGAPFCAGDGSAGLCPCGSYGIAGHGCSSTGSPTGAMLEASGEPSVSADTFGFLANELPKSTVVSLVQGDASAVVAAPFGAGLRCVSGNLLRISTKLAGASATLGGASSGVSISSAGAIPPSGGTRYYQVVFRDAPSACNASTINFTNGWRVAWRP